jgi:hypothetical protein
LEFSCIAALFAAGLLAVMTSSAHPARAQDSTLLIGSIWQDAQGNRIEFMPKGQLLERQFDDTVDVQTTWREAGGKVRLRLSKPPFRQAFYEAEFTLSGDVLSNGAEQFRRVQTSVPVGRSAGWPRTYRCVSPAGNTSMLEVKPGSVREKLEGEDSWGVNKCELANRICTIDKDRFVERHLSSELIELSTNGGKYTTFGKTWTCVRM